MSVYAAQFRRAYQTFGEALKGEREREGYTAANLAARVQASRRLYDAWEAGEAHPTGAFIPRLIGSLRSLAVYKHLIPKRDAPPPAFTGPAGRKVTFGEALRAARTHAGLQGLEVATLVGVTNQTVSAWELNKANPVGDNYAALLDLFDDLANAPEPDWRPGEKPNGAPGVSRNLGNTFARAQAGVPKPVLTTGIAFALRETDPGPQAPPAASPAELDDHLVGSLEETLDRPTADPPAQKEEPMAAAVSAPVSVPASAPASSALVPLAELREFLATARAAQKGNAQAVVKLLCIAARFGMSAAEVLEWAQ